MVQLQFMAKGFDYKYIFFKLLRSRDLGEFVPFFTQKKEKNDRVTGVKWAMDDFPLREICRNDAGRKLKMQLFDWKKSKGLTIFSLIGDMDFTISGIKDSQGKWFTCYNSKIAVGKIKLVFFKQFYKFEFIDYIHGGLDISLILAMDFTLSNGDPKNKKSMHHMPPNEAQNFKRSLLSGSEDTSEQVMTELALSTSQMTRSQGRRTTKVDHLIKEARGGNVG